MSGGRPEHETQTICAAPEPFRRYCHTEPSLHAVAFRTPVFVGSHLKTHPASAVWQSELTPVKSFRELVKLHLSGDIGSYDCTIVFSL